VRAGLISFDSDCDLISSEKAFLNKKITESDTNKTVKNVFVFSISFQNFFVLLYFLKVQEFCFFISKL
jgi:hypothetical protein